ncbi:MAG: TonB family protein [Azonexus sp.]|jgi:protein TonB|nr:TonB family protein [Azonexus sp.]
MSVQLPLGVTPGPPEWRRSGPFLLIAALLHLLVLAAPQRPATAAAAPPLQVRLVKAPQPQAAPESVAPPPKSAKPAAKPPVRQRPVLALSPEQQPVTAETPTVALLDAPDDAAIADAAPPAPPVREEGALTAPVYAAAYLNNPEPPYPALSRRLGEEGTVRLRVLVAANGQAASVELEESSTFPRLDETARRAVAHWRFIPARRGGEAIEAAVIVPIVFRIDD